MVDIRPPLAPTASAFGAPATVTVPWSDPASITLIWLRPNPEDVPVGEDYAALAPRWIAALRRDEIPNLTRDTVLSAPLAQGEEARNWQVVGVDSVDSEFYYVVLQEKTN